MNDRRARIAEDVLLVLFCISLASAFAVMHFHGPEWVGDTLIGLTFLLAVPFMILVLRRKWGGCG